MSREVRETIALKNDFREHKRKIALCASIRARKKDLELRRGALNIAKIRMHAHAITRVSLSLSLTLSSRERSKLDKRVTHDDDDLHSYLSNL